MTGSLTPSLNHWISDASGKPENAQKKVAVSPTSTVMSLGLVKTAMGTVKERGRECDSKGDGERERMGAGESGSREDIAMELEGERIQGAICTYPAQ